MAYLRLAGNVPSGLGCGCATCRQRGGAGGCGCSGASDLGERYVPGEQSEPAVSPTAGRDRLHGRTNEGLGLGQAPQVFQCTVDRIILDDFQVGDYRLRPSHYEKLMAIRALDQAMKNAGRQMSVSLEGFTDSSGKEVMNQGLSVSRAAEVQNWLVRVGVNVHNIVGSGESNPIASNATEAGRRKNRRVELKLCVLLPPPPPGGSYNVKALMRQVGFPATRLAGPPLGWGFGEAPRYTPWRERLAQRVPFMILDEFVWNEASLTPRLQDMVKRLAQHVKESWETRKPIGYIRLIGHTDNTGGHEINVKFGNSRAVTVKAELQNLLREEILKRRVAILVEESPGERKWVADNTTPMGRARNRRVEVYIEPPAPPPPPPPPRPDLTAKEPQKPVIQTKPGPYPWGKLPTLPPGKTFEQWAREWLSERVGNKWLAEQIWKSIAAKDFGLAASLLHAAKVSGPEINAFLDTVRVLSQVPTAP